MISTVCDLCGAATDEPHLVEAPDGARCFCCESCALVCPKCMGEGTFDGEPCPRCIKVDDEDAGEYWGW